MDQGSRFVWTGGRWQQQQDLVLREGEPTEGHCYRGGRRSRPSLFFSMGQLGLAHQWWDQCKDGSGLGRYGRCAGVGWPAVHVDGRKDRSVPGAHSRAGMWALIVGKCGECCECGAGSTGGGVDGPEGWRHKGCWFRGEASGKQRAIAGRQLYDHEGMTDCVCMLSCLWLRHRRSGEWT